MNKIEIIFPAEQDKVLSKLWKTVEFKNLFSNNFFFKAFRKKLKQAPIFFFEPASDKARNHLTSIFRFISHRSYENPYIHDLYYFHELCHCAHYEPSEFPQYEEWANKLSNNELFASLMSEAFIYFMDTSLLNKTFNNLWVKRFIPDDPLQVFDINGFPLKNNSFNDLQYLESIDENKWNPFNLDSYWPESIHYIIRERKRLRKLTSSEGLDEASVTIIKYNELHTTWISKWKAHYITIDSLLIGLLKGVLTANEYVDVVVQNCDEFGRPFYPKKTNFTYKF